MQIPELYSKKYFEKRLKELEVNYNTMLPLWRELAKYFLENQARFLAKDVNKTPKKNNLLDSFPLLALRNYISGMMSGATNPAKKWFKTAVENNQNEDDYEIKMFCAQVSHLFRDIFFASNFYQSLPELYGQNGVFAIGVMALEKDYDTIMRTKVLPVGSFRIARDEKGVVNTLYRVYTETASNLVEKFGEDNVSDTVKDAIRNGNSETPFEIVHAVEPNRKYKKNSVWAEDKKYISVYFERAAKKCTKLLRKSGMDVFPYVVFGGTTNGENVYPTGSPGMTALADTKQLITMIREYGKAVKKMVSPAYTGNAKNINKVKNLNDNSGSFIPSAKDDSNTIRPIHEVNPTGLSPLYDCIEQTKNSIGQIFYNDLFAMMVNTNRRQITATEIDERREEKMVLLSPLLEQMHTALKQVFDWLFHVCLEEGIIPPVPQSIQGMDLKIEFVSTLAQAQKASSIVGMERFVTFAANTAQAIGDPLLAKKVNGAKMIDDYADFANIDPDQIVPTEVVEQAKAAQAQQMAAQQMINQAQQGSEIVDNIAGNSASRNEVLNMLGL